MGEMESSGSAVVDKAGSSGAEHVKPHPPARRGQKRKRRHSSETNAARAHGGKRRGLPHNKKPRLQSAVHAVVSSTRTADKIMKRRLGGSVSDPLNLGGEIPSRCSTCAPSPVLDGSSQPPSALPEQLLRDPLNLEGKLRDFPSNTKAADKHDERRGQHRRPRKKTRRRTVSQSEKARGKEEGGKEEREGKEEGQGAGKQTAPQEPPVFNPKGGQYCYGNYDKYYGYRNSGVFEEDPRLGLLRREWFSGRDCLDIGCNTGQVTIRVARDLHPRRMVGIDIDSKLINMAWKNLHRHYMPAKMPDGKPFPISLTLARGPVALMTSCGAQAEGDRAFPHNVHFMQGNYIPTSDEGAESQEPEYDVILALSLTKWVHLNWGDAGIKRLFQRVYRHLRPEGKFILEPQPFNSYTRKKKLTPTTYQNYHSIQFFPKQFHSYLMTEVGFTGYKFLGTPHNKSKGFRRPLHLYIKGAGGEGPGPLPRNSSSGSKTVNTEGGTERGLGDSRMECDPVERGLEDPGSELCAASESGGGSQRDHL